MPHPGPVYDDAMRILAADDLAALLSVLGVDGSGASSLGTELPGSTVRLDLLASTRAGLVHVEYVKDPPPDLDLRMVRYRVRLRLGHRVVPIRQFVLVVRDVDVPSAYDDGILRCAWTVVRLPDLEAEPLLATPTTAVLAPLARGTPEQRAQVVAAAAEVIVAQRDPDRRRRLAHAATTLASMVLPRPIIRRALEEASMPIPIADTPYGQWLREEREEGRAEGRRESALGMVAAWLRQRFGDDARVGPVAEQLATLPDEERVARIMAATSLDELEG